MENLIKAMKDPSAPAPSLNNVRHCRIVLINEIDRKTKISNRAIKKTTGGDRSQRRGLFENGGAVRDQYKFLVVTNRTPAFEFVDEATRERVRIFPFMARWLDTKKYEKLIPSTPEEQYQKNIYPADPDYADKAGHFASILMYKAIEYYPIYYKERARGMPSAIKEITNSFWERVDILLRFKRECVEEGTSSSYKGVMIDHMYSAFLAFFHHETNGGRYHGNKQDFVADFENYVPLSSRDSRVFTKCKLVNHYGEE